MTCSSKTPRPSQICSAARCSCLCSAIPTRLPPVTANCQSRTTEANCAQTRASAPRQGTTAPSPDTPAHNSNQQPPFPRQRRHLPHNAPAHPTRHLGIPRPRVASQAISRSPQRTLTTRIIDSQHRTHHQHPPAVRTIAKMPRRIASGRSCHRSSTACRSGSKCMVFVSTAPAFAPALNRGHRRRAIRPRRPQSLVAVLGTVHHAGQGCHRRRVLSGQQMPVASSSARPPLAVPRASWRLSTLWNAGR